MKPCMLILMCVLITFGSDGAIPCYSQILPSTVTVDQWYDSLLAKWQSGSEADKKDAVEQLSALLLLISHDTTRADLLMDRLELSKDVIPDARMAIAFHCLQIGETREASQRLLDLILRFPNDPRINRFRIALSRSFRLEGQYDMASAQLDPLLNIELTDGIWALLEKVQILKETDNYQSIRHVLNQLDSISGTSRYIAAIISNERSTLEISQIMHNQVEIE